jgi:hypothetical protein
VNKVVECEIPWHDVTKWKPGHWYPCPVGFMARDQAEYIIDGYLIYKQDPEEPEDMVCLDFDGTNDSMSFSVALAICEAHNGEKLL